MTDKPALLSSDIQQCVALIHQRLGDHWVMGAPLGLGKPNHLINAIYQAAKQNHSIRLDVFTALSLNPPKPASGLKQRFLGPFVQRQFGDYPRLQYLADLDAKQVPENISISEFYFRSGSRMHDQHAQRHYVSSNYTHVARDMQARGINLLVQMVSANPQRPGFYSLGSNPDVTLDLINTIPREELLVIAQLNDDMPYMAGDAEISASAIDIVLEQHPQALFAVPRMSVSDQDYLVGLHASQLIRDGGTLQLGIGSLGDAVCFFSLLRHQNNSAYKEILNSCSQHPEDESSKVQLRNDWGGDQAFSVGLYAASEMFMEGFLHLYQAGILKRKVYDDLALQTKLNDGQSENNQPKDLPNGALLHAGFFLGSQWMYDTLNNMSDQERSQFQMTSVSRVNQLYGDEALDRAQRLEARFINTTMKMTLLGAAASDQLEDGKVVSGVGGQYNFVAMAHTLHRGRSILMLRSYRGHGNHARSNIVWEFPHITIPRHLRDIVITEYGVADLRSANDEEVIQKILCLADSRWQAELKQKAINAGKLDSAWQIPKHYQNNTPRWVQDRMTPWRQQGLIEDYPFGSDFTAQEQVIVKALAFLAERSKTSMDQFRLLLSSLRIDHNSSTDFQPELIRMGLENPQSFKQKVEKRLLCLALQSTMEKKL
jgi:acyl-CoA hydrolase